MFSTLIKDIKSAWSKAFGKYTPQEQAYLQQHAAKLDAAMAGKAVANKVKPKEVMDFVLAGKTPEQAVKQAEQTAAAKAVQANGATVMMAGLLLVLLIVRR